MAKNCMKIETGVDYSKNTDATYVKWQTIGGDIHEGHVVEQDSNVFVVDCYDGKQRCIEL